MPDLFLIAHKVRGEPAFDVAERMECPMCPDPIGEDHCFECNDEGYWWIIPTSGHRAYPWWNIRLEDCTGPMQKNSVRRIHISLCGDPPNGLPDHYPPRHASSQSLDISTLLAPAVKVKIDRRF